jgi:hypothetical protein
LGVKLPGPRRLLKLYQIRKQTFYLQPVGLYPF